MFTAYDSVNIGKPMSDTIVMSIRLHKVEDKDVLDYLATLPRLRRSDYARAAMHKALPAKTKPIASTASKFISKIAAPPPDNPADDDLRYVDDEQT